MRKQIDEKYLKSDYWNLVKKFRLEVDRCSCVLCGGNKNIDVYHTNDQRLGCEKLADVVTLCEECYTELCEFLDCGVLSANSMFDDLLYDVDYQESHDEKVAFIKNYLDMVCKEDKKTEKAYLNILEKLISLKNFTYISKWLKSYRRFIEGV